MSKEANEAHWMDIESVVRELNTGNRIVSISDVLQWCSQKKLKVSYYLFKELARPQNEYCPLLEDGYYQLVARKILQNEEAQLGSKFRITNPLSNTGASIKNYDFRSLEFLKHLDKRTNEHHERIQSKAKEIFGRWKSKGRPKIKLSYGSNTLLDGVYPLHVDKELSDWMKKIALGYEAPDIERLCVIGEEGEIFQIVDSNGEPVTFKLKMEDLIVTKDALLIFEEESGVTSKGKAQGGGNIDKVCAQGRREAWLKRLIDEKGLDALKPLGQLGVWNECAKLANNRYLFPIAKDRTSQLQGFFRDQRLIAFR